MLREEEKDQASSGGSWKNYSRSMSWTERPPRKSRACLPPLQPLSIIRPNIEEWPRAGSDDLGVWPNPPTPGVRSKSVTPRENSREFEFKKDKLAFFNKECSRILDHVYLGSDSIAKNRETLRQNGITHVLNCVGFVCPEYFKNELVYKTLWLHDCPSEDITSILYDVFDYFEDVREQNGRVLVHCCQGVSRSTSLVIAYLMWKDGRSFEDAFGHVRAAREVTDPNVGFACQLLQCQKRVHALPASPSSVLRMYRMAPHSPYDPLHLVPKMVVEPSVDRLDSRGAFIVHVPSVLYVWIGNFCSGVMSDNANAAASQVIRYERAKGPVITVKEGNESFEFWDALNYKKSLVDVDRKKKVEEYDVDFEIFNGALSGGVVPPFPLSGAGPETCLPVRENGWNRLRRKFASGIVKEFITSSKLNSSERMDTSLSRSPSFSLEGTFSSFLDNKPKSNSTSPSLSPSTSDYSSSFTFSPSSSNWSDLSFVSAQPSPYGLESDDTDLVKTSALEESAHYGMRLPAIDEASQVSEKLTRYLEDDVMSEVSLRMDGEDCEADDEVLQDEKKYDDTFHLTSDDMTSRVIAEEATNLVIYQWPSLHKMDGILDSRSVYVIPVPAVNFGTKNGDVLYVWIGKGCHCELMKNDNSEDSHHHLEIVARNHLIEKGFCADAQIKIVKEGGEPVQLLEHLARFSLNKAIDEDI